MARKKVSKKPEEAKSDFVPFEPQRTASEKLKKVVKIIIGLIIIIAGLFLVWVFLPEFVLIVKGVIGVILVLVGLLVLALGWLD